MRYDSSGVILSPGWPESYPNLQMCSWSVTVEKGYNVTITFESFHTEREFDVLEIFDGKKHKKERRFQRQRATHHTHRHIFERIHTAVLDQMSLYSHVSFLLLLLSFFLCLSLSIIPSLSLYLNPCQVPHPTAPPWRHLAVTCQHPLTSRPLDTSS